MKGRSHRLIDVSHRLVRRDCKVFLLAGLSVLSVPLFVLTQAAGASQATGSHGGGLSQQISRDDAQSAARIGRDGVPLIRIPSGEFVMGGRGGHDDEQPAHRVYLDAFYLDKYEVTVERYAAFLRARRPERPFKWGDATKGVQGLKPVIGVDWYDAKEYCEWSGRRLPTEAEWERAARGTDQRTYPWGEDAPTTAHANAGRSVWNGYDSLATVGSHARGHSADGIADLAGNVWEWIADRYDQHYYEASPERNPTGPSTGPLRVLRGGAWNNDAATIRAANRAAYAPAARRNDVGFRCALDGKEPAVN